MIAYITLRLVSDYVMSRPKIVKYRPCRGSVSIASIELGVPYEP